MQQLHKDFNEGCAVGDINNDGHLDVTAGAFCYHGPRYEATSVTPVATFSR